MKSKILIETASIIDMAKSLGRTKRSNRKLKSFSFMFDAEANAAYIKYEDKKIAKTIAVDENTNADFDSKGNLIGIEYLNINK
jgi:uncharacterized protein YuzE